MVLVSLSMFEEWEIEWAQFWNHPINRVATFGITGLPDHLLTHKQVPRRWFLAWLNAAQLVFLFNYSEVMSWYRLHWRFGVGILLFLLHSVWITTVGYWGHPGYHRTVAKLLSVVNLHLSICAPHMYVPDLRELVNSGVQGLHGTIF